MMRTMIGVLTRVTIDMNVSSGTPTVRHSRDSSKEKEGWGGVGRGGGEGLEVRSRPPGHVGWREEGGQERVGRRRGESGKRVSLV